LIKLERRLSLKKPAIVAGLVLTLVVTTFFAVSMDAAHAAPVAGSRLTPHMALLAAKAQSKHKSYSCSSGKFRADPCKVIVEADGSISFSILGHGLNFADTYMLYPDAVMNACQGTLSVDSVAYTGGGVAVTQNGLGSSDDIIQGGPVCAKSGKYVIFVQDISVAPYPVWYFTVSTK
jgi:hypothetical protein